MSNNTREDLRAYFYRKQNTYIERGVVSNGAGDQLYSGIRYVDFSTEEKRIQMQREFMKNPENVRLMKTSNKMFLYNKSDFTYGENTAEYQDLYWDCDIPLSQYDVYKLKRNMDDVISITKDGESLVGLATREVNPENQTYKSHFNIKIKPQKVLHAGSSFVRMISSTYSYFNNCFVPEFAKSIGTTNNVNTDANNVKTILKKLSILASEKAVEVQEHDDDLFKVLMMFSDELYSCAENMVCKKIIQKSKMIEKIIIACKNSIAMKSCPEGFTHSVFDEKITNQVNHMINVHEGIGSRGYQTVEEAREIDLYDLVTTVLTPEEIMAIFKSYDYNSLERAHDDNVDTYKIQDLFGDIEKRKYLTMAENIAYYIGTPFRHKPVSSGSEDDPFTGKLFLNQKALKDIALHCWIVGNRHNLSLKLAGTFARMGISEDSALAFIEDLCYDARDEESEDRIRCVEDTYDAFSRGINVYGFPSLKAHLVSILTQGASDNSSTSKFLQLLKGTSDSTEKGETVRISPICYSKEKLKSGDHSNYPFIDLDEATSPSSLYKRLHQYCIIMSGILFRCYSQADNMFRVESTNENFSINLMNDLYNESEYESLASFKTIVTSMVKILKHFNLIEVEKSKPIGRDEKDKVIRTYTLRLLPDGEKFVELHPLHMVHMSSVLKDYVPLYLGIYDYIYDYNELGFPTLTSTNKVGKPFTVCLERVHQLRYKSRKLYELKQEKPVIQNENRGSFDFLPDYKEIENFFFKVYQLHKTYEENSVVVETKEYDDVLQNLAESLDDCNQHAHDILSYESINMFIKCLALADIKLDRVITKELSGRLFRIDRRNAQYYNDIIRLSMQVLNDTEMFEKDKKYQTFKNMSKKLYINDLEFRNKCKDRASKKNFNKPKYQNKYCTNARGEVFKRVTETPVERDQRIRRELLERERRFKR